MQRRTERCEDAERTLRSNTGASGGSGGDGHKEKETVREGETSKPNVLPPQVVRQRAPRLLRRLPHRSIGGDAEPTETTST